MKTSELQIGNWVLVNDRPVRVGSITKKKIGYHRGPAESRLYYARAAEVKPIVITEELLVANGFGKSPYSYGNNFNYYKSLGSESFIHIEYDILRDLWTNAVVEPNKREGESLVFGKTLVSQRGCKYLHQLQNLYSLVDIKLEIKL